MKAKLTFEKGRTSDVVEKHHSDMCFCVRGIRAIFPEAFYISDKCILEINNKPSTKRGWKLIRMNFHEDVGWMVDSVDFEKRTFLIYSSTAKAVFVWLSGNGFLGENWEGEPIDLWVRMRTK